MKKSALALVFSVLCLFSFAGNLRAQTPSRSLTLAYSNNINAEIDPCPT